MELLKMRNANMYVVNLMMIFLWSYRVSYCGGIYTRTPTCAHYPYD
jgi:hypothetical protein